MLHSWCTSLPVTEIVPFFITLSFVFYCAFLFPVFDTVFIILSFLSRILQSVFFHHMLHALSFIFYFIFETLYFAFRFLCYVSLFLFFIFFCCMFYSLSLERIPDSFSIFSIRCPFRSDLLKKENKQTNKQIKGNRQTEFSSNPFVLFASRGSVNLASLPRR